MKYKTWSIVVSIIICWIGWWCVENGKITNPFNAILLVAGFFLIIRPAYFYWVRLFNQKKD